MAHNDGDFCAMSLVRTWCLSILGLILEYFPQTLSLSLLSVSIFLTSLLFLPSLLPSLPSSHPLDAVVIHYF